MKVAVVHDWLITYAGSERVVAQILKCFPEADLFAVVDYLDDASRDLLGGHHARASFIQGLPFAKKYYKAYLPLMPLAIEQFDLRGYDLIISSSHAVAKGVLVGPDQVHISYVHSPMRYAWDLQGQYLSESGLERGFKSWAVRLFLHYLRVWDLRSSAGVDKFISNSNYIARRILKAYRRESFVIYPPVDTIGFVPGYNKGEFYLTASRLVPYKRVDLVVEAFNSMPERHLVVIGDGPEISRIREMANDNVTVMGYQSFSVLRDFLQRAKAFVFAAEEDFGILPVEAQACGTPVIAFGRGGVSETVSDGLTGVLFHEQSAQALIDAIKFFEENKGLFVVEEMVKKASMFSEDRFRDEFKKFVLDTFYGARRQ